MIGVDIYNGELGPRQYIFFFRARSLYQQMRIKRDKINMLGGYGQLEFQEMDMPQLLGQDPATGSAEILARAPSNSCCSQTSTRAGIGEQSRLEGLQGGLHRSGKSGSKAQ